MKNNIVFNGAYYEMFVPYKNKGKTVYFSEDKLEEVKKYNWNIWKKHSYNQIYYYVAAKVYNEGKQITLYLHHLIFGKPEYPNVVDHINRNPLDNRNENLRFATRKENVLNSDLVRGMH